MQPTTIQQGQQYTDPAGRTGIVNFDTKTGSQLAQGATTVIPTNSTGFNNLNVPISNTVTNLNTTPVTTPPAIPPTSASGTQQFIQNSTTDPAKIAQQQAIDAQQKTADTQKNSITSLMDQIGNAGQLKEQAYQQGGVDQLKSKVDEYTSQIEAEAMASRRQIEDLQRNNPQGMFGGAVQSEINKIQRDSTSKQADLAILQNSFQRKYETAAAIAERQVQDQLEPMKARLDTLKFLYQDTKESLTKKEDRQYQEKIKSEDRTYQQTQDNLKNIADLKLTLAKNGAPASALNKLSQYNSYSDALSDPAINNYFTSPADKLDLQLKRIQLTNAQAPKNKGVDLNAQIPADDAVKLGVPVGTTWAGYNALQGNNKPMSDLQQTALNSATQLMDRIKNTSGVSKFLFGGVPLGGASYGPKARGSNAYNFEVNYNNLKSLLSLDNIKLLKGQGAVSDAERQLLSDASSKLDKGQNPKEFEKTLQDVINVFQSKTPEGQYATTTANMAANNTNDPYSQHAAQLTQ